MISPGFWGQQCGSCRLGGCVVFSSEGMIGGSLTCWAAGCCLYEAHRGSGWHLPGVVVGFSQTAWQAQWLF